MVTTSEALTARASARMGEVVSRIVIVAVEICCVVPSVSFYNVGLEFLLSIGETYRELHDDRWSV